MESKVCTKCHAEKSVDEYRRGQGYKNGIKSYCKQCEGEFLKRWRASNPDKYKEQWTRANKKQQEEQRGKYDPVKKGIFAMQQRDAYLRRTYDIGLDDYIKMHEAQDGLCAICEERRMLVVDHCHKTGKVRSLLCDRCNRALGVVNDDTALLGKLNAYLTTTDI